MKKRMIYKASSEMTDMSKDRVHLNLSYEEWRSITELVDSARYICDNELVIKDAIKVAKMIEEVENLPPIWDEN